MNLSCEGEAPKDKRGALKWHNRRAIVAAAGELADRHGIQGFSVNDLAKEAGVSRRTIFNHFSSAEDAGYEYLSELIARIIGAVLAELPEPTDPQDHTLTEVYRDLCTAMRAHNLVGELRSMLLQVSAVKETPTAALWSFRVTNVATEGLLNALRDRLPRHADLELQLVATTVINSMSVCMDAWLQNSGGELTDETRGEWDRLLAEALDFLGRGFET